jgi:ribonuclease HI
LCKTDIEVKYYVVWKGHSTGIFSSWKECQAQIKNFPGAVYKSFPSKEEAENAWAGKASNFIGQKKSFKNLTKEEIKAAGKPITDSISVDAACSGNPGKMEYRGVMTGTGEQLFHQGVFEDATVNIGEFLAIVHALALLKKKGGEMIIYSDSRTAIKWVKDKKTRSKLARTGRNKVVFELIGRAEKWLQENDYSSEIRKWNTAVWGEIPADFGRK